MVVLSYILSGLVVGIAFGIALQRGRFCFNSAFRDALLFKDNTIIKALGVAVIVEMVGFQLTSDLGLVQLYPRGLYWGANIMGGFLFGVGMVLAGGCISGQTYRTGEGMVGSLFALAGIAVGGSLTINAPLKDILQAGTKIEISDQSPTIPSALGISPWLIIIPVSAALAYVAFRTYRTESTSRSDSALSLLGKGWPWWFGGMIVGIIVVISYPIAEAAGRSTPLAMTGGYMGILATIVNRDLSYVGWEQAMVIGAIAGAAIGALLSREWKIRTPPPRMIAQSLLGGLVMGVGAVLGDGCNITTILVGVPLLSLGGMLAGAFTILGCWTASYIMFR